MLLNLEHIIGIRIRVTNRLNEAFDGNIYSFNTFNNTLTVQEKIKNSSLTSFRIIKVTFIKRLKVLQKQQRVNTAAQRIEPSYVDPIGIERLLNDIFEKSKEEEVILQHEISPEDIIIFELLNQTFPKVMWRGSDILLMEDVKIEPPYKVDNIIRLHDNSSTITPVELLEKIINRGWEEIAEDNGRKGG